MRDRGRRHCPPRGSGGFSLIEILVAFSIASVALAIIFQIYSKGTTSAILGKEYAQAVAIAESRLDALGGGLGASLRPSRGTEQSKYHWAVEVTDRVPDRLDPNETHLDLKEVRVEVTWDSGGNPRSITLHSLRPFLPL